jgi:hypothetical protein
MGFWDMFSSSEIKNQHLQGRDVSNTEYYKAYLDDFIARQKSSFRDSVDEIRKNYHEYPSRVSFSWYDKYDSSKFYIPSCPENAINLDEIERKADQKNDDENYYLNYHQSTFIKHFSEMAWLAIHFAGYTYEFSRLVANEEDLNTYYELKYQEENNKSY